MHLYASSPLGIAPLRTTGVKNNDIRALYITSERPDTLIENQYYVYLTQNYTLDKHFEFISQDLSKSPGFEDISWGNAYLVKADNWTVHEKIRRDPGVKQVEEAHRLVFPDPPAQEYHPVDSGSQFYGPWQERVPFV